MLMKIINYKLVQFSLVLSMGIVIGYFLDSDKPVTKVVYSEQKTGIDDSNALSGIKNQQQNNLVWVTLGTWNFDAEAGSVTLDADGSSGGDVVISDAVKAVKQ